MMVAFGVGPRVTFFKFDNFPYMCLFTITSYDSISIGWKLKNSVIWKPWQLLWFYYPPSPLLKEDYIVDASSVFAVSVPVSSPLP